MAESNKIKNFGDKLHTLTAEESARGGKKSGETRRRKRDMREELEILLAMCDEEGITNQEKITIAQIKKAITGDTSAYNSIRDTVGDKPVEKVEAKVEATVIEVDVDDD